MDYPYDTIYEPTWLWPLALFLAVLLLTYPVSLLLVVFGVVKPGGGGRFARLFRVANSILRTQASMFFFTFLLCTLVGILLLVAWIVVYGAAVIVGLMELEVGKNLIGWPLLVAILFVHVLGQVWVYVVAVRDEM